MSVARPYWLGDQKRMAWGLLALLVGLLLAGAVALSYQARIDAQRDRNDLFRAEIALLDAQIKEVAQAKHDAEERRKADLLAQVRRQREIESRAMEARNAPATRT